MPISVVIPLHNQVHSLDLALRSLATQTLDRDDYEVILVDDASDQDLRPHLRGYENKFDLRYLRNETNRGRSATRNCGVAAAKHQHILFLDGDSFATDDLLRRHHDFAAGNTDRILLGRRLEPGWWTLDELAAGRAPSGYTPLEEDPRYSLGFDPATFHASRTPWLFAYCNNMSLPRALFVDVGGFNEDFYQWGYEDNELAYRIFRAQDRRSGHFRYDADAITYHLPHFRDWRTDWEGAKPYVPYIKDAYRHYDVELLGAPPQRVAQAVPYYESCVAALRASPGRVSGAEVAAVLPAAAGDLWFGFDLDVRQGPRVDHARPADETNLHLFGVHTPFPDGEFARVVNVDLWRMLGPADLSALMLEAFRLAPEVTLVASADLGDASSAEHAFITDLDYAFGMIAPYASVTMVHEDARMRIVRCATPIALSAAGNPA